MVPSSLLVIGLGTSASAADCPSPRPTAAALFERLAAAQTAYAGLDVPKFRAAMAELDLGVPCVTDEIPKHLAAELHRFEGLREFLDRNTARSSAAFAAARTIEPTYRFPESLVPAGNPALQDYVSIDPDKGRAVDLPLPLDGRLMIDGMAGVRRSTDFPTLVQLFDGDGRVTATAYLWPGDPVPSYVPRPPDAPDPKHGPKNPVDFGPDQQWVNGATALAIVSGALYGTAYFVHRKYEDPETLPGKLGSLRTVNNGLVLASGATALGAVGVGAGAFLVARF
jgi:hypothetical protein